MTITPFPGNDFYGWMSGTRREPDERTAAAYLLSDARLGSFVPYPERVSIAPTGREYSRLTHAELAEIMPTAAQPLSSAITVASVVLVFVAGWVVGLLTVLFTL